MSRVGKKIIIIPKGVEIKIDGRNFSVKGPKGELKQKLHPKVSLAMENETVTLKVENEVEKSQRALWGLFGRLISNMIEGVTAGYVKKLEIQGVGFKANASGKKVVLNVGFSHPVEFAVPAGVEIKTEENIITVSGADKQLVGETAAQIRRIKPPEPYKGKGIRYVNEAVRRKAGKAAATAAK